MKRNQRGFTLMELMVVIVIVAILAAVAVPLYINYVKDAQRTEAKGAIGAIISAEQVYYQANGNYLTGLTDVAAIQNGLRVDLTESSVNWSFSVSASTKGNGDGFVVIAKGVTGKTTDKLGVTYTHSRTNPPDWQDEAPESPSNPPGGGGSTR